ncbi:hypothetical protein [Microbulbifer variabilis]|uniref:hypothetical protein n=1 Tax=Microbulbifer variabilis TaxID=266805 RepID=UPI001CFF0B69|nr:hypothetical protein [Microbulbifer variabilis]
MTNKEVRIPPMHLRKIEKVIGVAVSPDEEGKFSSFQEVDELTRSRVREIYYQLDELRAIAYLKYFLPKKLDREHMFSFLSDVIIGGMDQDEWVKEELGHSNGG